MWSGENSIRLSRICVLVFSLLLAGVALSAPWLVTWFLDFSRADLAGNDMFFFMTIYSGSLPAALLLHHLYRLLRNLELGQVFIQANVEDLRRISWCSFAGALICLMSALYYIPWFFVAVAAAFMGLIVRVVKNVFAQAVELQNESELTI